MTVPLIAGRHALIVKKTVWLDEAATRSFAQRLARRPALRGALIELHGDLGSGKTTFVRHLLASLGVPGRVKSPTYAVVESYAVGASGLDSGHNSELAVWHFDFYRFTDAREWEDAGFRDIFASPGLKLVEWPDMAGGHLPRPDLAIAIDMLPDESRSITLTAYSPTGAELLA
ncbi:MAG: tRNA (adenosine(37)-N6)-threonylcarbamoyltransferase complex ATPase subunit type 1 TsaE [Polaromonas sp.]|nr:tRNA (adenosine(37)-N6)-threonylcarbamoyltransferase complex ATPase subunit type 1 TsaE [Polaromonas sp.]